MSYLQTTKTFLFDVLFPCFCLGCGKEGNYVCVSCRATLSFMPPVCASCGALSPGTKRISPGRTCLSCQPRSSLYAFLSPFSYDNKVTRAIVHGCKYARVSALGVVMGDFIAEYIFYLGISLPAPLLAVPVPLHPRRMRVRGFNQSERIAERVCERILNAYASQKPSENSVSSRNLGISSEAKTDDEAVYEDIHQGGRIKPQPKCRDCSRIRGFQTVSECLARKKHTVSQVDLSLERRRTNMEHAFFVPDEALVRGKDVLLLDDVKTTGATLEEAARVLKQAGARRVWAATFAH